MPLGGRSLPRCTYSPSSPPDAGGPAAANAAAADQPRSLRSSNPQPPQLPAAAPRRACVRKAPPPRRRRPPPPRWPHCRWPMGWGLGRRPHCGVAGAWARPCVLTPSCSRSLGCRPREGGCVGRAAQVLEALSPWALQNPFSRICILEARLPAFLIFIPKELIHNFFLLEGSSMKERLSWNDWRARAEL